MVFAACSKTKRRTVKSGVLRFSGLHGAGDAGERASRHLADDSQAAARASTDFFARRSSVLERINEGFDLMRSGELIRPLFIYRGNTFMQEHLAFRSRNLLP